MDQELFAFPVFIQEKNEIRTLFLKKEDLEKARQDEVFLTQLIANEGKQQEINETSVATEDIENIIDKNNADKSKVFIWPDKAVLLLLEMYREREEDFSSGSKRSNKIWAEIAVEMKEANFSYEVTGPQCASKMSGLKRTYKNIADLNKKSGNHKSSWAFFSVMDSIFGEKASINPLAIATSDGPVDPCKDGSSSSSTSSMISCSDIKSPQRKRKRMEHVFEELIENIAAEKEEKRKEAKERETRREKIREESRLDREKRHTEQMDVQKSLVSILQQFLHKK